MYSPSTEHNYWDSADFISEQPKYLSWRKFLSPWLEISQLGWEVLRKQYFNDIHYKTPIMLKLISSLEPNYKDCPGVSDGKETACNVGDWGSVPGLGRSPGEGKGYPLQYSCRKNPHGQKQPGGLQSIVSQRVGHDWATELKWIFITWKQPPSSKIKNVF